MVFFKYSKKSSISQPGTRIQQKMSKMVLFDPLEPGSGRGGSVVFHAHRLASLLRVRPQLAFNRPSVLRSGRPDENEFFFSFLKDLAARLCIRRKGSM